MRILFVTAEVAPYSKTGGLADASFGLAQALSQLGHDVSIVTPRYGSIAKDHIATPSNRVELDLVGSSFDVSFCRTQLSSRLEVCFVESPFFGNRLGIYGEAHQDYDDNTLRFALLSRAATQLAQQVDVIHAHDWHAALSIYYAALQKLPAKKVFTIHNLAHQGLCGLETASDVGVRPEDIHFEAFEFYSKVNLMKGGIAFADAVTTVSPRYAHEIQTHEGGHGLDGFLRKHTKKVTGILNGIDTDEWNSKTDLTIPLNFDETSLHKKDVLKKSTLEKYGLTARPYLPLFGVIGRMVEQKGVSLILEGLRFALSRGACALVLGSGEQQYEEAYARLHSDFQNQIKVTLGYDERQAHLIEASCDFFLMPSLFEPCGLNQMYSMAYGTLPIVRSVGGLKDSVTDIQDENGTGIRFDVFSPHAMIDAIERAFFLFANAEKFRNTQINAMKKDFSWSKSAEKYLALYSGEPTPRVGFSAL